LQQQIVFTTLQTWHAQRKRLPSGLAEPDTLAIVWDEVHWGFNSKSGRRVRKVYQDRVPQLGLSATPPDSPRAEVIYSKRPEDFFGTVLVTPICEQVKTGVDWAPEVNHDEYTPASLLVLAKNHLRNKKIADKAT
jgi:superfamily II DNA or RNA helicase